MHSSLGRSNIYMILMMNLKANYNIITASKWNFLKAERYLHVPRCPSDVFECIQFGMKPKEWTWASFLLVLTCFSKASHFWVCVHVIEEAHVSFQTAMEVMEFSREEVREVLRLLAGILHLGNVEFITAGGAQVSFKTGEKAVHPNLKVSWGSESLIRC